MENARLRQSLTPIWNQINICKINGRGTSAYAGIPKYQFWSYPSLASFNLKLLEKVHKNEENEGESIEHITRSIVHLAQDRKLSEMAKVWTLREPCLVSGLLPPSPRNYLRTGSICQSPPSQPLPDDPRRIKYKLPDCSHWLQHSDIQTSLVFHEYFANQEGLLLTIMSFSMKLHPRAWTFSLFWQFC